MAGTISIGKLVARGTWRVVGGKAEKLVARGSWLVVGGMAKLHVARGTWHVVGGRAKPRATCHVPRSVFPASSATHQPPKILQDLQPHGLALLWMILRGKDVVARDRRGELDAVVGTGGRQRRLRRYHIKRVDEVDERAV